MSQQDTFFLMMGITALVACYGGFASLRKPKTYHAVAAILWGAVTTILTVGGLERHETNALIVAAVSGIASVLFLVAGVAAKR